MRVLVLHSGGMDSTTCLYKAKAEGADVYSLGIAYGQGLAVELLFAKRQCESISVPREVISVAWRKPEREIPTGRNPADMVGSVSKAFLPARNVTFLSIAVAHAAGLRADEVHIGINAVDYSGYPDCTVQFLEAFREMMAIANPGGAEVRAPLLHLSKPEIAKVAKGLGIGPHDTWSCYRPQLAQGTLRPCEACDACKLHEYAWRSLI